jgi:uncharacterized protein (DUF2062 family)
VVWHLTKSAVSRWAERLLHIHDTPERTARAFAIGVAIGFSPPLGLHTGMGLAVAFAFNLNRVAVLLGVISNLPWFVGPFYALATAFGAWLLGTEMPGDFVANLDRIWQTPGWWDRVQAFAAYLQPLLPAYLLGSSILAAILAVIGYYACLWFIRTRQKIRETRQTELP